MEKIISVILSGLGLFTVVRWLLQRCGLQDNGRGADEVRAELDRAAAEVREAGAAAERDRRAARSVAERIGEAKSTAGALDREEQRDRQLIGEYQSILERVRAGGEESAK